LLAWEGVVKQTTPSPLPKSSYDFIPLVFIKAITELTITTITMAQNRDLTTVLNQLRLRPRPARTQHAGELSERNL
jgi:hypothetical protein